MAADTLISMVVRLSVTQRGNFLVVLQSGGSVDVEIPDHSILIVNVWGVLIMARFKRGEIRVCRSIFLHFLIPTNKMSSYC